MQFSITMALCLVFQATSVLAGDTQPRDGGEMTNKRAVANAGALASEFIAAGA